MINLVIIDDHAIVRQGLVKLLNNLGNFQVIQEIENGKKLIEKFDELKENTDLFILDYSMPIKNGLETMEELFPKIGDEKFLILTQNDEAKLKISFYRLGARGFISKTCSGDELKNAITQIVNYGFYNFHENLKYLQQKNSDFDFAKLLTSKELEFIEWVCDENEFTYEQIADRMNLSIKTIDYYRNTIFQKFEIKSKAGLILFSHKHKLTKPFK